MINLATRYWPSLIGVLAVAFLFGATEQPALAQAWEHAHGDGANNSFLNVPTAPAKEPATIVAGLGTFAPGAGPVIGRDGMVYLGTLEGKLIALHADGSLSWTVNLPRPDKIVASPVIGSNNTIYVIGVHNFRDHRLKPDSERFKSTLYAISGSGVVTASVPFPDHDLGPAALAAPNIWRSLNTEIIMVPAKYIIPYGAGVAVRLFAFSLDGQVLAEQVVAQSGGTVAGGADYPDVFGFHEPRYQPSVAPLPLSGAGIFTSAGGGTPFILVSDQNKDLVTYTFATTTNRFTERVRVHKDVRLRTSPVILPDGHSVIGGESIGSAAASGAGAIIFAGPNGVRLPSLTMTSPIYASPTLMADGRVAVVAASGKVSVLRGADVVSSVQALGESATSAAASRTHIFVSAVNGFATYDTNSLAEVARFDWYGGGLNPPAIGPKGHVYAIAANKLVVFAPPKQKLTGATTVAEPGTPVVSQPGKPITGNASQPGTPVATDPGQPVVTPQPREQAYKPPMTVNGNRLFACEELDGDDCGKGDYKSIAKAFCEKAGFAEADDIDVDSKKVKAETLDGRFCSKGKCKVFDKIVCKNHG